MLAVELVSVMPLFVLLFALPSVVLPFMLVSVTLSSVVPLFMLPFALPSFVRAFVLPFALPSVVLPFMLVSVMLASGAADAVDLFEEIWSDVQKISLKNSWTL